MVWPTLGARTAKEQNRTLLGLISQGCRWRKQCWWRAGRLAGDGGRDRSGRGQPARSWRWAVQVRVYILHTGAGWAWWRVSVRRWLRAF